MNSQCCLIKGKSYGKQTKKLCNGEIWGGGLLQRTHLLNVSCMESPSDLKVTKYTQYATNNREFTQTT